VPTRKKELTSKDIAILLKKVTGAPHQEMIHMLAVRAMARAVYTTKNIGHFGLSLKHYTHFTSPIRRYPDIVVHRLLLHFLLGGKKLLPEELREYEALSRYSTQMEITATNAERTSIKYKQAEYMSEFIGQTYDGTITGLTERGIFVAENETRAEGMIRLGDLHDDYYVFDEKKFSIIGRKRKKKYSLGDRVKIKVKNVNLEAQQIDYVFAW
jgi:ribonuclease R